MSSFAHGFYYNITYNFGTLTQQEINANALRIRDLLRPLGWTDNAIAGLLANIQSEGIFNPGQCENSYQQTPASDYEPWIPYGIGLCQWTGNPPPAPNPYPNLLMEYSHDAETVWYDGSLQCSLIDTGSGYFINRNHSDYVFPYSFSEFKAWTGSPYESACGWLYNYERPGGIDDDGPIAQRTRDTRGNRGLSWYEYITSHPWVPTIDQKLLVTLIANRKNKNVKGVIIK